MSNIKGILSTIGLLFCSNIFMTYAWYGHLKDRKTAPLIVAIVTSWLVAFFEYCLMVPANRIGHNFLSVAQLKIMQEAITLVVFTGFSVLYLKEGFKWNYLLAFLCIMGAVFFTFFDFGKGAA